MDDTVRVRIDAASGTLSALLGHWLATGDPAAGALLVRIVEDLGYAEERNDAGMLGARDAAVT